MYSGDVSVDLPRVLHRSELGIPAQGVKLMHADEKHAPPVVARTVKGFCEAYGVGKTTCYKLIAEGKIEARKPSPKKLLITEESARAWVASLPVCTHVSGTAECESLRTNAKRRRYQRSSKYRKKRLFAG